MTPLAHQQDPTPNSLYSVSEDAEGWSQTKIYFKFPKSYIVKTFPDKI